METGRVEVPFYRPTDINKFPEAVFKQNEKVGGYFGYKQTLSKNEVTISHSNLSPGDAIKIKINSDQ